MQSISVLAHDYSYFYVSLRDVTERVKDVGVGKEGNTPTVSHDRPLHRSVFVFVVAGFVPQVGVGQPFEPQVWPLRNLVPHLSWSRPSAADRV